MTFMKSSVIAAMMVVSASAHSVMLSGSQTAPGVWSYALTLAPLDNYSVFPIATQYSNLTKITLTGLWGVTGATGPTATTFPFAGLNATNLNWVATVLNGGTEVQWTHVGPGTGNFTVPESILGFQVFSTGVDGAALYETSGFSRDTTNPLQNGSYSLDVTGSVDGPVAGRQSTVPEPMSLALLGLGLGSLAVSRQRKRRMC